MINYLITKCRLISWAGSKIEPYGVDFILQRLGFTQARTTIPKWIQRGACDPLDKLLSILTYSSLSAFSRSPEPPSNESKDAKRNLNKSS